MLFANAQEFLGNAFLALIAFVAIWMWIIQKLGLSGLAKEKAKGVIGRLITSLFK